MNFASLTGLSDSYGNVVQIADASGRVLWSANKLQEDRAVLTVAKETDTTIAGETTYENESFILLNIYPLSGGTVNVTYGGLTKTITDDGTSETPNAQSVYFGTLYGVSDSVSTPDSGTLTIEGNFSAYGCGDYTNRKSTTSYCLCITNVVEIGKYITTIPRSAFQGCTSLTGITIPNSVTSIGEQAFSGCTSLALTSLPSGLKSIGPYAFQYCKNINIQTFPEGLESIGDYAFFMDLSDSTSTVMYNGTITLPSTLQSIGTKAFATNETSDSDSSTIYGYLNTVRILATTPPSIDGEVFGVIRHEIDYLYVPSGCFEIYMTEWGVYGGVMKEDA